MVRHRAPGPGRHDGVEAGTVAALHPQALVDPPPDLALGHAGDDLGQHGGQRGVGDGTGTTQCVQLDVVLDDAELLDQPPARLPATAVPLLDEHPPVSDGQVQVLEADPGPSGVSRPGREMGEPVPGDDQLDVRRLFGGLQLVPRIGGQDTAAVSTDEDRARRTGEPSEVADVEQMAHQGSVEPGRGEGAGEPRPSLVVHDRHDSSRPCQLGSCAIACSASR